MPVVQLPHDAPIINAIIRGAARAGHAFNMADTVEVLDALLRMDAPGRSRLIKRLEEENGKAANAKS